MKLKLIMLSIFIILYGSFLYINTNSKNQKIELALNKQIDILQTHYLIAKDRFSNTAKSIQDYISNNQKIIDIFSKAQDNITEEQKDILRKELYQLLTPAYKRIKNMGVLQFMFIFPDNTTFLRMHKPSKYGDDLTNIRYSIKHTNETKKETKGFEQGRTTHGFRYVFPFYDKNNKYLGTVETSFSSYALQEKLLSIHKIHTHFLVNKKIFKVKAWKEKDLIQKYIPSAENPDYLCAMTAHSNKEHLKNNANNIISHIKDKVVSSMSKNKSFALYVPYNGTIKVIAFLPIKNTQNKDNTAYLVSYTNNNNIYNIIKNYKNTNILLLIVLLFLFYFIYRNLINAQELKMKVKEKTKELENNLNTMKALLDSSHDGIIMTDSNNKCISMNATGLQMYQIENEAEAIDINILEHVAKDSIPIIKKNIIENNLEPYEITCLRKDGTPYPALVKGRTVILNDETFRISSLLDMTKIYEQEKLLIEQSKMVAMGEMMESIAHQWRQPLSAISVSSSGMKLQQEYGMLTDEIIISSCDNITNSVEHLSQTIDDFRDFFKKDKVKSYFKIGDVFEKTTALLISKFKNREILIIKNIDNINMNGFGNELVQVFMNILNNARDELETKDYKRLIFIDILRENDTAIIKIKDNAGGISEDIIDKIFDSHFTTKEDKDGTGIGLYMTKKIIENNFKGSIEVVNQTYSYEGLTYTGVEFIILLPIKNK